MNFLYKIILFILLEVKEIKCGQFGYSANEQKSWKQVYHDCGGHRQSPIIIDTLKSIPVAIPSLELINYHNMLPDKLELANNGHSVSLHLNTIKETISLFPYIFGSVLENQYVFNEIHFHWGAKNNRGSEHILDNIQYPLEMHLVHQNRKYYTTEEALKKRDGLVVLAVLFQLREKEYKPFNVIIDKLKLVKEYRSTATINSFELIYLLPKHMDVFYLYTGSLTTPPCAEAVTWMIFPDPILISPKQINEFHILKNSKNVSLSDNFRYPQSVEDRKIYKRMSHKKSSEYKENINLLKKKLF